MNFLHFLLHHLLVYINTFELISVTSDLVIFFLHTLNHAVKLCSVCCPCNDIKCCLEGGTLVLCFKRT